MIIAISRMIYQFFLQKYELNIHLTIIAIVMSTDVSNSLNPRFFQFGKISTTSKVGAQTSLQDKNTVDCYMYIKLFNN